MIPDLLHSRLNFYPNDNLIAPRHGSDPRLEAILRTAFQQFSSNPSTPLHPIIYQCINSVVESQIADVNLTIILIQSIMSSLSKPLEPPVPAAPPATIAIRSSTPTVDAAPPTSSLFRPRAHKPANNTQPDAAPSRAPISPLLPASFRLLETPLFGHPEPLMPPIHSVPGTFGYAVATSPSVNVAPPPPQKNREKRQNPDSYTTSDIADHRSFVNAVTNSSATKRAKTSAPMHIEGSSMEHLRDFPPAGMTSSSEKENDSAAAVPSSLTSSSKEKASKKGPKIKTLTKSKRSVPAAISAASAESPKAFYPPRVKKPISAKESQFRLSALCAVALQETNIASKSADD